MKNDLYEMCKGIANDLKTMYEGFDETEEEERRENGDPCDLWDYLADVLDVEYTLDYSKKLIGVRLAITLGGPNIYIDTREGYVKGYWGTDKEEVWIPSEIRDEINMYFEETF